MRAPLSLVPVLVFGGALALPAPAADPPTQKELRTAQDNMKAITLAAIKCADNNTGRMATNVINFKDKDRKELLSWRVELLPELGEEALYKQFKLDEPWDSEANKKLIEKMPKVYAPARGQAKAGETFCQVFYGKGALFGPGFRPRFPASIPDGPSKTAMVVEAGEPVIWTKPADLPFDAAKPLPKLGGVFDGDVHVGMCDGTVRLIKKGFDEKEMKQLITPAGEKPVPGLMEKGEPLPPVKK